MDIFYSTKKLSLNHKKDLLALAKIKSIRWFVNSLDVNVSYSRRSIDMNWETILDKLDQKSHFVVIHRKDFTDAICGEKEYGEIGFSTIGSSNIEYYLFIYLSLDELYRIIELYDLKSFEIERREKSGLE